MRPGLEEAFDNETKELLDTKTPYAVRLRKLISLIQSQEGCVRIYEDGSIVSPINPEDVKDCKEYLDRLRQLSLPL